MPKVTIYQCPFTKEYFETRRKYINHLRRLRKKQAERRARRKAVRARSAHIKAVRTALQDKVAQIDSINGLEQFITNNFRDILISTYGTLTPRQLEILDKCKMEKFEFQRIYYSDKTRNTHNCPRGGVTNWGGRDENKPRGYPGFSGQMKWTFTAPNEAKHFHRTHSGIEVGYALRHIGIHTGTGCPAWNGDISFEFYLSDFPGLQKTAFLTKLKGKPLNANTF